ncbi:hypothetical protein [Litchfieldella xinjiangensis]|uniref:hypothetical protein n=1 Tax=Litchfieldella xinjiangensis TaxID=1166948 RepID=UPI0005BA0118|nr:hypothetical protein [Halomonas xinjiangensis]
MGWISNNSDSISAIASVLTLFVWVFYAQLLYANYSRQRRARIIINRGSGKHIHSLCLISNMSAESIYVQHIVAVLETEDETMPLDISDFQQSEHDSQAPESETVSYSTHQGPLGSGDYLHVGTFSDLVLRVAQSRGIEMDGYHPKGDNTFVALEIRLIGVYGPEDAPIGARRRFLLNSSGRDDYAIMPDSLDTERMDSMRQRRLVKKWMRELSTQEYDSDWN